MLEGKVYRCLAFYASWKATLCLTMYTEFSIWKAGEGVGFFSPSCNKCKDVFNICVVQQNSSSQLCGIVVLMIFFLYIIPIQCLILVHFFSICHSGPAVDCLAISLPSCRTSCTSLAAEHKDLLLQLLEESKL